MSLEKLLVAIKEGNYVQAKDAFYQEVNERVSNKIDEKRSSILEGEDKEESEEESDDDDEEDENDDDDDDSIKESLYSMSESEMNSFVDSLNETELNVLLSIIESDEYLMEGIGSKIKSGLKKTGNLVKRTAVGTAKDVARNLGRGAAVAAGGAAGMAAGGIPGAVAGGVAGNMAYQAGKDTLKKKLAARNKK
jgi:hypothetical protein